MENLYPYGLYFVLKSRLNLLFFHKIVFRVEKHVTSNVAHHGTFVATLKDQKCQQSINVVLQL